MSKLNLALIQTNLIWENPKANRDLIDRAFETIKNDCDLILLPEMFTTGFSMRPERLAEAMDGDSVQWLLTKASEKNSVVAGSLIISEHGKFFNRFLFAYPDGTIRHYDKRHLFTLAGEHLHYTAGQERIVLKIKDWKVMPQVCYDLRFPTWARNNLDYDLLVYVANWPKPRHEAWRNLLVARAIENQCYVAAVNRVGSDDNDLEYLGGSTIIDYSGQRLVEMKSAGITTLSLEKQSMDSFRQKLNFLSDQDEVEIKI